MSVEQGRAPLGEIERCTRLVRQAGLIFIYESFGPSQRLRDASAD